MLYRAASKSERFIVGLTNISPLEVVPKLFGYVLCGQYPGSVGPGKTVTLRCQKKLPPFQYVIVQLETTTTLHFCELQVMVRGMCVKDTRIYHAQSRFNTELSPMLQQWRRVD